jgi:acyl carrier protein
MNNPENEKVLKIISQAIQSFNEQLPPGRKLISAPECQLVGSPNLDSAEIVNLMVMIEQQVERDLGITITLFDAVEQFVSIQALTNFLAAKIGGNAPR